MNRFGADLVISEPEMPDMRPFWHQLVVLGNGFDLECKLSSTFSAFMQQRSIVFEARSEGGVIPEAYASFKYTLWDEILNRGPKTDWCDVEGTVTKWLLPSRKCYGLSRLEQVHSYLVHAASNPSNALPAEIAGVRDYIASNTSISSPTLAFHDFITYVLDELHEFEGDFATYLSYLVRTDESYAERALRFFGELLVEEIVPKEDYDASCSILCFNYTTPLKGLINRNNAIRLFNVHGSLDANNIAFGIDGKGIMDKTDLLPFTKTYRLMELGFPCNEGLVRPFESYGSDEGTMLIKFYGHSLGEADYSYFQSMFDTVDLYGGKTRLIFYCRTLDGQTPAEAKAEMMRKVIRLLDAYGRTLDNKDHGANLIHKLLLEGRLDVREAPAMPACD